MAQPTGQSYHVQGPTVVYTGTGSAGAGETLGVSEDGVDIRIEETLVPIKTDAAGEAPAEFQKMGQTATIRMRVPAYDDAVLLHILSRGDRTAAGAANTPGTLVHTNSYGFKLGMQGSGTNVDNVWYFPFCTVKAEPVGAKIGSKYTAWDLVFHAISFVAGSAANAKDVVLFARTFPGGFPS